ncbi:alanine racemase, partial [Klebsiella pneumoniae]|uniref:alanine racemase n=1 Tax=Klebsiella pneumoniae TaxID=573 RepID=UPI00190F92FC
EEDGIKEPLASFELACRGLPYPRSLANSAGIIRFPEVGGDFVRPGIMLYGATPLPYDTYDMLGLRPVMTLRS